MNADRKLTLAGLRILGLCIVLYALIKTGTHTVSAIANYNMAAKIENMTLPQRGDIDIMTEPQQREATAKFQAERNTKVAQYRIIFYQDMVRIVMALLVFAFGLYLCRGGELLLRFLKAVDIEKR